MKIKITLKDPDGVANSIYDAVESSVKEVPGLSEREREHLAEERRDNLEDTLGRWIRWGEYVTIEIDTDEGTARVVPND
jgi:hypothetical protein